MPSLWMQYDRYYISGKGKHRVRSAVKEKMKLYIRVPSHYPLHCFVCEIAYTIHLVTQEEAGIYCYFISVRHLLLL